MDNYIAQYVCKERQSSTIPGQYSYAFGLVGNGNVSVMVKNTYSHFEIGKKYMIVISDGE